MANPREVMRERCDRKGLHWAKGMLPIFPVDNENFTYIVEWISEQEADLAARLEAKQLSLTTRSVEAAETSANAALESAKTSGASARASIFAALVSFFALLVAVAAYFKQ